MSKALYRKYRSRSLSELVGQPHIVSALENSLKSGKVSHAYLFIGPRGTGKTSVARILAHAINDFDYQIEDNYLDIIEIDAASNTGVDNIRDLREKALIAPSSGKYKVYIIDEVHMLSKAAFNALLKTLEEPPAHIVFIMATTDAHKVPITITSRAQVFTFKLADADTMVQHLRRIAEQEGIKIQDEALHIIAKRGGGSFRDSISLLDQISTLADSSTEITADFIISALGLPQDAALEQLLQAYQSGDLSQITSLLKDLIATGIKPEIVAEELLKKIIEQPQSAFIPLLAKLVDVPHHHFPLAQLILALCHTSTLAKPQLAASAQTQPVTSLAPSVATPSIISTPPSPAIAPILPSPTIVPQSTPTSDANTHIQPTLQPPVTAESFNSDIFLQNIKTVNMPLFTQLQRVNFQVVGGALVITPATKIAKKILENPNNQAIMLKFLGELNLEIANPSAIIKPAITKASTSAPAPQVASSSPATPTPAPQFASSSPAASSPEAPTSPSPIDPISAIMGETKEVNLGESDIPV